MTVSSATKRSRGRHRRPGSYRPPCDPASGLIGRAGREIRQKGLPGIRAAIVSDENEATKHQAALEPALGEARDRKPANHSFGRAGHQTLSRSLEQVVDGITWRGAGARRCRDRASAAAGG